MRPGSLHQVFAMLLLGALALVVLPQELWHDCAGEEHAPRTAGAAVEGACAVCELAFPAFVPAPAVALSTLRALVNARPVELVAQVAGVVCEGPSPRGPPQG